MGVDMVVRDGWSSGCVVCSVGSVVCAPLFSMTKSERGKEQKETGEGEGESTEAGGTALVISKGQSRGDATRRKEMELNEVCGREREGEEK